VKIEIYVIDVTAPPKEVIIDKYDDRHTDDSQPHSLWKNSLYFSTKV